MTSTKIAVLVVEDEPLVRLNIVMELEDRGLQVVEAENAIEAIAVLSRRTWIDSPSDRRECIQGDAHPAVQH